ncbi:hypothetical protein NS337_00595 [Pseudomonas oryzihabitans]|uniref:hypothetical protein n=1 Tax=Pseudomonas oryzihabitans TaxID=47885 RepID=UPI0007360BF7|nr:hypothetical protein [Pseudomonas psychrotolerans]KTT57175.1 hypothetical protein NS337_00595 [Pseudomonas psychrotolerans]
MRQARTVFRWALALIVVFLVGTGSGYVTRTWECRNTLQTIYVAAPGFEMGSMQVPAKLYAIEVSACTLPEQWGGHREPLKGYP